MADHPKTSHDTDIEVHGHQNVTIAGDVGGDVIVTVGVPELRRQELDYLADIIRRRQAYAEKYTPMSGVAEVTKERASDPLPSVLVPPEFMLLRKRGGGMQAEVERVPVSDLREAIRQHRRMVLLGEPGSGKTTTLWDLAYHHALEAQMSADAPLPIFVPLGGYTGPEPALEYVKAQAGALGPHLTPLLQDGRAMLLLDALNEMPSAGYHERVRRVQTLLSEFREPPAVVTCRALDYVETLDLHKLEIQPLGPLRQRAFVENYLGPKRGEALFWQMAGEAVEKAWQAWQKAGGTLEAFWAARAMPKGFQWRGTPRRIRERLQDGELPPLMALGRNPYMLFMMVQVYRAGNGILAGNKGQLFTDFATILMERERHRVDQSLWPGEEAFHRALVKLAYAMQSAGERGTAVDAGWANQQMVVGDNDPAWLLHLARRASLLDLEAGKVRFVHQLIQEYFAAVALGERLAGGEDLRRYWPNGWVDPTGWEEAAVLLAGILPDISPLVKQLLVASPPLAARCITESGGDRPAQTTVRAVQQRLCDLTTDPNVPIAQRNAAGVALNQVGDPRRGVGLRADGLPDIEWVFIPGKEPKTGQRVFVYGDNEERRIEPNFWIARYPITYAQFRAFLDAADGFYNPFWWQGLAAPPEHCKVAGEQWFKHWNHPRENVSWYDAVAFCRWLTEIAKGRSELLPSELQRRHEWRITLPTERQWEKAARGHDGRKYPWGNTYWEGYANIKETFSGYQVGLNCLEKTSAVGMYLLGVSPYAVADMSGNVWEWCLTEFDNPDRFWEVGGVDRVVRGGSWANSHEFASTFFRRRHDPHYRYYNLGFRVSIVKRVLDNQAPAF